MAEETESDPLGSVRKAGPEDREALSTLIQSCSAGIAGTPQMLPGQDPLSIPGVEAVMADREGSFVGSAGFNPLAWDSDMVCLRAARLLWMVTHPETASQHASLRAAMLTGLKNRWVAAGIQHVSARCDRKDRASREALVRSGFQALCPVLDLAARTDGNGDQGSVRRASPGDVAAIRQIAERSFVWDRYHEDPHIDKRKADFVHAEWAANCAAGRSDVMLVAEREGHILGFSALTLSKSESLGRIELLAVCEDARGQGLGAELVRASLSWFSDKADRAWVGTQASNIPALRLYLACGFRPERVAFDFRWWREEESDGMRASRAHRDPGLE